MQPINLDKSKFPYFSIGLILFIGIAAYSNSLHAPLLFDDLSYLENNPAIYDLKNFSSIRAFHNSRPVGTLTFALNYHFHGLDVFGYHALNLTVHLLSSILLWWLMLLTFAAPRLRNEEISKYKGWIALFSALIFTAHPVQTQAVTYITQRYSSLSAMFYLAALALYMRGRIGQRKEGALCWAGAVISAILGMFTKEHVITLPFLIVVAQWLFLSEPRGLEQKSRWPGIGIVLFFALALIVPAIYSFNIQGILGQRFISESHGQEIVTSGNYFLTQLRVLTTYIS